MTRVLLVEADPELLDLTAYVLRRERFVVIEAADGEQALKRWKTDRPDIVVLDLGIPTIDGFEVLRRIRDTDATPVVVTARKDPQVVLRAFNLGGDDFLAKPLEFRELAARIRAILRRARGGVREEVEPRVQLDGLSLDPETSEVNWHDAYVRLTPTEFRILYVLVTNAGQIVPVSRLYTYVWGSEGGDANALRSHVSHVRRKLEACGDTPGTITSVPAIGYVFQNVSSPLAPKRPSSADESAPSSPR